MKTIGRPGVPPVHVGRMMKRLPGLVRGNLLPVNKQGEDGVGERAIVRRIVKTASAAVT